MRLACVFIPRFPLAVERQSLARGRKPSKTGDPRQPQLIVYSKNKVVEASLELMEAWPGRALRQARALYPHVTYVPADHARYAEAWATMLRALEDIAPEVEPDAQGCAYVGVAGLERLYREMLAVGHWPVEGAQDQRPTTNTYKAIGRAIIEAVREATGLAASVSIASGKFVARVGALLSAPGAVVVVPEGGEQAFLREASVGLLPFEPQITQRLRALALDTLGDVAALPRPAIEAQFRSIGGRMWDLANGIDETPLIPRRTPEAISERLTFESPVVTSEALIMAARQIVRRLAVRLDHRAARKMHAQVLAEGRLVWDRVETFRDATADEARMMTLLKTRLSSLQLTEAVDTVAITLSEIVREPGRQAKLITETNPQMERLLEAVHEIRARFGGPMVWRAVEVDPCSRHPEDRAILIPYDA
jgi:nucleotidyltransferase/DNA polymerase involved in DNA repair